MIDNVVELARALLLATSAAILVIAMLRPIVRRYCGAVAVLNLWWILPISFVAALIPKQVIVILAQTAASAPSASIPIMAQSVDAAGMPWRAIVMAIWLAGVLATAAWHTAAQRRFTHRINWQTKRRGVLPAGSGPAVVGAISPRLVLPEDFANAG